MRRADRLFEIVQLLRSARGSVTARQIADALEVVPRTIYRDIAALQGARVPIDGEAGVGYILRSGYDLPPLMFEASEIEAIVLGARLVANRGDAELAKAAANVLAKVSTVMPERLSAQMASVELHAPRELRSPLRSEPFAPALRSAIRSCRKVGLSYRDQHDALTERVIWPLGLAYFVDTTLIMAWCEHRTAYRAFRIDRITSCAVLGSEFDPKGGTLLKEFLAIDAGADC